MPFPPTVLEQAARRRLGEPIRAFDARSARRRALGAVWRLRRGAEILRRTATPRIVYLFVHGLVVDDGRALAVHHWDELTAVTVSGVRTAPGAHTRWRVTITAADGREITLGDGTPEAGVLGEMVSAEVTARVVPRLMAAIEARERVRVGPFTLSPNGIDKDGDRLPWRAVADVGIDDGVVYARDADGLVELTALAARMPNAVAFVEVCRRVRVRYRDDDGDRVH